MSLTLTLCKFSNRRGVRGEQMPKHKGDRIEERVYKSLWHLFIAGVGLYEFRHHKSKASKILSAGLILFHVDAAIADALDEPPISRRILDYVRPEDDDRPSNNRRAKSSR